MSRKLAIVGSRSLEGSVDALLYIKETIKREREQYIDLEIVSGWAIGIDRMAEQIANEYQLPTKIFAPKGVGWEAYKIRNNLIANYCDALVCISDPNSKTHGCLYTANKALELGKEVIVHEIAWPPV